MSASWRTTRTWPSASSLRPAGRVLFLTAAGRAPKHQPDLLDAAEQLRGPDIERVGEAADRVESDVLFASLDAAEVIAVHSGEVGALLLGEASLFS